jgi:hypothetical protein
VTLTVSHGTVSVDGVRACSKCGAPRDKKKQRYCKACRNAYSQARRAGMVEVLLTPEEWAAVKSQRAGPGPQPLGG